jgi:hypothetical protein
MLPQGTLRPTRTAEASAAWGDLLADVTGRPTFATPLIAALSEPLSVDHQRRFDRLLAETEAGDSTSAPLAGSR